MFIDVNFPADAGFLALRESVRTFLRGEIDRGAFKPTTNSWMVFDREFSGRCGEAGFVGLAIPGVYGGAGRSLAERHVVFEELLAAGAPVGSHWIADRQSSLQLLRSGRDRLKRKLLPRIATGRCSFAIGMSEADVGSDLASVRARATKVNGGWELTGTKLWSTNAHRADYMIALFRTSPLDGDRHKGLTQFVIDLSRGGVVARPMPNLAGDMDFCEVAFDGYIARDDEVLGEPGDGWKLVMQELVSERSAPDRYLSTFALLSEAVRRGAGQDDMACEIGRLISRLSTLQAMSLSVAKGISAGRRMDLEALIVKDIGTHFEQEVPESVRRMLGARACRESDDALEASLAEAVLYAPSFSLRGGTREILRGIIASTVRK